MKNILLLIAICLFTGCNTKSSEQKDQRAKSAMEHEAYIDSLVNVATGINGVSKPLNRKNALNILRKEYPNMKEKWDRCEECINNMEIYSE